MRKLVIWFRERENKPIIVDAIGAFFSFGHPRSGRLAAECAHLGVLIDILVKGLDSHLVCCENTVMHGRLRVAYNMTIVHSHTGANHREGRGKPCMAIDFLVLEAVAAGILIAGGGEVVGLTDEMLMIAIHTLIGNSIKTNNM